MPDVVPSQAAGDGEQLPVGKTDRRVELQKLSGIGPMYRQIADDLRLKIESGELGHGDQLPTELELREGYDASRNTVRDAVKWLITRGLIETRPGQGTFVVGKIDPYVTILTGQPEKGLDDEGPVYRAEVEATLRKPTSTEPRVEIQQAVGVIADALQLSPGSTVVSRHQQRYIDGTPWSLQTSFYPMSLVERGALRLIQAPNIKEGTVSYLGSALGLDQAGWRDKITVRVPDATETSFFKLPDDGRVAVFEVLRTAFGQDGKPFRLTISVYPADRNQFSVEVGKVPREAVAPPSAGANGTQQR
jgi:GntR family transcriptional regulator